MNATAIPFPVRPATPLEIEFQRAAAMRQVSTHQLAAQNATAVDLAGHALPQPRPICAALHPVVPFDPIALLPEALRDWVMDEADRMPCAPDFVAAAVVVALGTTIGARCAIKPKARDCWLVVPNLWGGNVGLPSAKRSPRSGQQWRRLTGSPHRPKRSR
jgi:hypothetical protein